MKYNNYHRLRRRASRQLQITKLSQCSHLQTNQKIKKYLQTNQQNKQHLQNNQKIKNQANNKST